MTWIPTRRALVAGLGATLAALTTGAKPLRAQSAARGNSPARHEQDKWMDELPSKHRIFVDTASREGGQNGVQFAGNVFNVNESAYGVKPADVGLIICFRHQSTPYGYNEAMWAKYGEHFSQRLELPKTVTVNPLNPAGPVGEGERTVATLSDRGAVIAVCAQAGICLGDDDRSCAAHFDFVNAADNQGYIIRSRDEDDREALADRGERTVFELG